MSKEYITSTTKLGVADGSDSSGSLESVLFYGQGGEIESDGADCYAKKNHFKNAQGQARESYYIKSGRDGSLFDPWGMFTEGTEKKEFGSESYWRFKAVNKKCFELYVRFLESKNNSFKLHAEREIG